MRLTKKMYLKRFIRGKRRAQVWDKSVRIPSFLFRTKIVAHKGVHFKIFSFRKYFIGNRVGEYVLTRKFFNQSHFLTKKRR